MTTMIDSFLSLKCDDYACRRLWPTRLLGGRPGQTTARPHGSADHVRHRDRNDRKPRIQLQGKNWRQEAAEAKTHDGRDATGNHGHD
jgi:hypothetical protein